MQLQSKNAMLRLNIYYNKKLVDSQNLFYFFFMKAIKNLAKLKLQGRRNFGNEEGLQISCKIQFIGEAKHIDKFTI